MAQMDVAVQLNGNIRGQVVVDHQLDLLLVPVHNLWDDPRHMMDLFKIRSHF